jgi:type II secretory pathway pseudopilin PulG
MRSGNAHHRRRAKQRGFGYLLVLFALAALGLSLAGTGQVWHTTAQREKEADLLFVGNQYRRAIESYYKQSPDAVKQYPLKLEDLLEDKRFPTPKRHLRQLYRDPMTGSGDWGLMKAADRIVGVYSTSDGSALKTTFLERDAAFAGTSRYAEWVFSPATGVVAP